ncbi:5-formyltetrahydrofolate cyclo-ligase [Gandjariella thermophila]|uniref:5-formyltetrahydrofolate cyclo-ligase n=1 Tax=Gandjariella thermophila TaxID=1931992 RepID=A0A4D4JDL1_9PSEU|nr:5-formyltetrahydrofolate cyclo-ligase [Gandjariella thermophila]GDY33502.1 5-formyltetrahydrofolate cyclo-ligase [Gandjariella thermophila]
MTLSPSPSDKTTWRARLQAARKAVPAEQHAREAEALVAQVGWVVGSLGAAPGDVVCGYVPVGTEPGSLAMIDVLRDAGYRVLLPVVPMAGDRTVGAGPLDWAEYQGAEALRLGRYRLREPAGPTLGPPALALAKAVLVPALAVDRAGVRLGRGAGYYDRSLTRVEPGTPLVAVVRDDELVEALPSDPHDVLMTAALTPTRGLVPLG